MCRIFGHFSSAATPHEMRLASATQRHGGPDLQRWTMGAGWALGSNRLAITGIAGGEQPYRSADGLITAVFNGEIYNHNELRRALRARGHTFGTGCDGALIPALYQEHGPAFVELLDGMFAIAVVDLRAAPTLLLATDDAGMKPLYYHLDKTGGQIWFASEIAGLLSFREVDASPWLPGLDAYLTTKTPFGEQTMFANVKAFPPATTMMLRAGHGVRRINRVRGPVEPAEVGTPLTGPVDSSGERVLDRLTAEVDRLVQAEAPVCAITSGGLDSSLVTALAARRLDGLHTFNIAYRGQWPGDERHFARQVAERCGATHHQVEADPDEFPSLLADVVWHLGQPNADPITISSYALFAAVRAAGFKVALTGDAADEHFGGYDRMKAALADGDNWIPRYLDALAVLPTGHRQRLYTADYRDYLAERAADELDLGSVGGSAGESAASLHAVLATGPGGRLDAITRLETRYRLPAYHLRRVDHLSMAHAVEARLPFCQPGVVALASALPQRHRIHGESGKRALYAAARHLLPTSVLDRPKQPFTLPIAAMLRPGAPLMSFAQELLAPAALARQGLLDPAAVRDLLAAQAAEPSGPRALAVWALMVFQLWAAQFGAGARPPAAPLVEARR